MIHNVPQIGVQFRLQSNKITRSQHAYTFWQSVEHSYKSKVIAFQGDQSTNTSMLYNTGYVPIIRENQRYDQRGLERVLKSYSLHELDRVRELPKLSLHNP